MTSRYDSLPSTTIAGNTSMRKLFPLVATVTCSLAIIASTLQAAEIKPLLIYGASLSEERAIVVKFHEKDGKPALDVVQSEPLGARAGAITYHPEHRLLYICAKDGSGFIYAVQKDGSIKKLGTRKFNSGHCFLALDRSRRFLLGACYESGNIDVYEFDKQGLPTKLADSRNEKKTLAHSIGVSNDNRFAYVSFVKEENALYQYHFDAKTGKLKPQTPATVKIPGDIGPRHLVFHPTKPFVYYSNEQQLGVSAFKINDQGGLEPLEFIAALKTPPTERVAASDIVITPDGRFLYVGVRGFGHPLQAVFGYAIQKDGRLKQLSMTKTDTIPWALGMSPAGDHLFVSASKQGTLTAFAIDSKGGLKQEATVKIGKDFWDILVLPGK
jgi:6-phosphogluconolactonase